MVRAGSGDPILTGLSPELIQESLALRSPDLSWLVPGINKHTGGLHRGEIHVLAGAPGAGKTSIAVHQTAHLLDAGKTVLFLSREMPCNRLLRKFLACMDIPPEKEPAFNLFFETWGNRLTVTEALPRSIPLGAYIDHLKADLFLEDYIQCGIYEPDLRLLIARKMEGYKKIAKVSQCAVLVCAQLGRGMYFRPNTRPNRGDIKESGAIDEWAATVIILEPGDDKYLLHIDKCRYGFTGTVPCTFNGAKSRLEAYTPSKPGPSSPPEQPSLWEDP